MKAVKQQEWTAILTIRCRKAMSFGDMEQWLIAQLESGDYASEIKGDVVLTHLVKKKKAIPFPTPNLT